MIRQLAEALKPLTEIAAVVMGGSRGAGNEDAFSDTDLYVYCSQPIPESRRELLAPLVEKGEYGNDYWEYEDNLLLKNGEKVDIIYRNIERLKGYLSRLQKYPHQSAGYSTCFWHNILHGEILWERNGAFTELRNSLPGEYSDELRRVIVQRSWHLIAGSMVSYSAQIRTAAKRGDVVSLQHRVTGLLSSSFDLLFALNRQLHPGEKKLLLLCRRDCPLCPADWEERVMAVIRAVPTGEEEPVMQAVEALTGSLRDLLRQEGLLPEGEEGV